MANTETPAPAAATVVETFMRAEGTGELLGSVRTAVRYGYRYTSTLVVVNVRRDSDLFATAVVRRVA